MTITRANKDQLRIKKFFFQKLQNQILEKASLPHNKHVDQRFHPHESDILRFTNFNLKCQLADDWLWLLPEPRCCRNSDISFQASSSFWNFLDGKTLENSSLEDQLRILLDRLNETTQAGHKGES